MTQRAPRRPSACDTTRPRLPPHAPRHSHPTSAALGSSVALSHTLLLAHLRGLTPPTDVAPDLSKYCFNQRDVCCHVASSSQSLETPEEQKRRVWGPLAGQLARADHIFLKPTLVPPGQLQLGPLLQDGGAKQAASPVNSTPQSLCASELCSQTGHCLAQRQARAAATAGQAANQQGRRRLVPTLTAKHWPGLLSETHTHGCRFLPLFILVCVLPNHFTAVLSRERDEISLRSEIAERRREEGGDSLQPENEAVRWSPARWRHPSLSSS